MRPFDKTLHCVTVTRGAGSSEGQGGSFFKGHFQYCTYTYYQRWSPRGRPWPRGRPRGHILKSLALASKVKSLALASRPEVLENWPVLGSRTALFFGMLKFCGALEKFFGKRFLVEIA